MDRLDTPVIETGARVLQECSYRNGSDRMVIVRCCGTNHFFLERVVFPFELLTFTCPPLSEVNVWSHGLYGPDLIESFTSEQLLAERSVDELEPQVGGMFPHTSAELRTTPWLMAG